MNLEVDPVEYGRMLSTVETLDKRVSEMERDIKTLLELANKGKGGFWVGMTIASFLGAIVSFVANHFVRS